MNNNRPYIIFSVLFAVLCFATSCEIQADGDELDQGTIVTLDSKLDDAWDTRSSDPENALIKFDEIIEQAKSASSSFHVGKALWYKALIYDHIIEDVSKAYFAYKDASRYLKDTDDATLIVKVSNNLAILNKYYGQYDIAEDIYLSTLEYQDDIDPKLLSNIYYNLGRTYKQKADRESFFKAEEAFTQSLEIAREIDDHENIASVNNQVGLMYKDLGNYDMARIAYQNNIRTYENVDPASDVIEYVGKAYHGIGVTYMEEENYEEAKTAFEKALTYKKRSSSIFITKYDLGTVLQSAGYVDEAIATWKDALSEKHRKNDRIQVEIYAKLTSALAAQNEFQEAVSYAQLYNQEIDNILTIGERYKSENNEVIFADIIREYDEFNRVIPFYQQPWFIVLMVVLIAGGVYAGSTVYYRSRMSHKESDTMSKLQMEFQNIKLE